MIAVEDTVLVLLAAGRSERFGNIASKLGEPFLSRPLGLHVAVALGAMPFRERVAVVGPGCPLDYAAQGFTVVLNDHDLRDLSSSVRLGIDCARAHGAKAVMLALADMPRVTASHVYRLFDSTRGIDADDAIVASSDGQTPLPPALFGQGRFDELLALEGDRGAAEMIARGRHVVTTPAELIDVDTPEELEQLRQLVHAPEALSRPGTRRLHTD